jgi:mitochondrial import receptor subunit TOM20
VTLASHSRNIEEIKAALEAIRAEPLPAAPEEKEQYFMDNVAMGEGLCARGEVALMR